MTDPLMESLGLWDDDQPVRMTPDQRAARTKRGNDFADSVTKTVKLADKLFVVMKKKGLQKARAKCPDCPGWLQGRHFGPRAARFWCDGTCGKRLIS